MPAAIETDLYHGVLTLDKPLGWTSHDVVAKVRSLVRGSKVGHAGTLDPAATGVLPVLIGQGTRIAEYLVDWDKEYRAVVRLGATTDTQDATGRVLETKPVPVLTVEQVRGAARRFEGSIEQVPPMYSALKVGGVPLYRSAREGKTVERAARPVTIHALDVLGFEGGSATDIGLRVHCSKGTYIRTLCADLGEALGCGGHLLSLQRSRVGPLKVEDAHSIDAVCRQAAEGRLSQALLPVDEALGALPSVTVDAATAARVLHGVGVPWSSAVRDIAEACAVGTSREVRIKDAAGRLLAIGSVEAEPGAGSVGIRIRKVLVGQES